MAERYFLGIDGGGTHCRARLCDAAGRTLGEGAAGSANVRLGLPLAWSSILSATRAALTAAGLHERVLAETAAGLGLAGAVHTDLQDQTARHPHPFACVRVLTDAHAAVLGAFGGEDGAILILGTGSCGMLHQGGEFISVGGLGFPISDHASGAWLGLRAVRAALLALDGLRESGPLSSRILDGIGRDSTAILQWQERARPADYAAFAPAVFAAAAMGDRDAVALVGQLAAEAEMLLDGLMRRGASRVCLVGGMSAPIRPLLHPRCAGYLVEPAGNPLDGAVLMARQGIGRTG